MQDRSLGTVELHIADLAKESDDPEYPYKSTGIKSAEDPIRLDKGEGYKGRLTYTAEFVPALALKNLAFSSHSNQGQQRLANDDGSSVHTNDTMSSSDHEMQAIPPGVTIKVTEKGNHRVTQSMDSTATGASGTSTGNGVSDNNGNGTKSSESSTPISPSSAKKTQTHEERGVEMSIRELLTHREFTLSLVKLNSWFDTSRQNPVLSSSISFLVTW